MAKARRQKINGVIDKRDLAEIFRRAQGLMHSRLAGSNVDRKSGRLGKALIKELLSRAVMVQDRPSAPRPAQTRTPTPTATTPSPVKSPPKPVPELPTPQAKKARKLLDRINDLTDKKAAETPTTTPRTQDSPEPLSLLRFLEEQDANVAEEESVLSAPTELFDSAVDMPSEAEPGVNDSWAETVPVESWAAEPLASDSETFLSLSELTSSLSKATKGHLDDQAAARTFIEDIEMPDALDDPDTQKVLARVAQAEEISFEGYLEDIEELLLETYEHYKNLPQALDNRPVDPAQPDLLGPEGKTLETRRADRKASLTIPSQPSPPASQAGGSRGHLVPSEPIHAPLTPIVPQQAGAQGPHSWQPDPFKVDPFAEASPPAAVGPPDAFAPTQSAPAAGGTVDPFALNPYTGQSMAGEDPFKLDPFNPFGSGALSVPAQGGLDPFMNPYGPPGAAPPGPQAFSPQPLAGAPLPPPKDPFAATPGPVGSETPKPKTHETLGYDPFADPNESQDPYSWPSRPPKAMADAQALAEEAAEKFDPFGPNSSSIPGMGGVASSALTAANPFGPGNMFGSQPTTAAPGGPIYVNDSDEFARPPGSLGANETKRAFENALVVAGLRGMLEYQRPTPGHGSSHPLLVIYDATTGLFKTPLTPRMSVGDRFQLKDGQIYRVNACRVFEVEGVACYQEAQCKPLGQLNMPLRDSWDGSED